MTDISLPIAVGETAEDAVAGVIVVCTSRTFVGWSAPEMLAAEGMIAATKAANGLPVVGLPLLGSMSGSSGRVEACKAEGRMEGPNVRTNITCCDGACDGAAVGAASTKAVSSLNDGRSVGTLLGLRVGASIFGVAVVAIVTAVVGI
jgi:hypothetical protein